MTVIRKLLLATASVLACGIGGAALSFFCRCCDVARAAPTLRIIASTLRRWAQIELHTLGLYNVSLESTEPLSDADL
jgi:hypothetical protein